MLQSSSTTLSAALVALACVICASPALAKEVTLSIRAKEGGEQSRTECQRKAALKAVEDVLRSEGLSAKITGEAREALVKECVPLLTQERFQERRGKWRYTAKIDLDKVREKALAGKSGPPAAAVELTGVIELSGVDPKLLPEFRLALAERLAKSGHRLLGEEQKAKEGALVLSIRVAVKLREFPAGSPQAELYQGQLRLLGSWVKVYDRAVDAVLLQKMVRSDKTRTRSEESNAERVAEPVVPKQADLAEAQRAYVLHLADWLGGVVARKLASVGGPAPRVEQVPLRGFSASEAKALQKLLRADARVSSCVVVAGEVPALEIKSSDLEGALQEALRRSGIEAKLERQPALVVRKERSK